MRKKNRIRQTFNYIKIRYKKNDSFSPQVEYLFINPYTHEKIDLSLCENTKINIYVPFNLSEENINLYNFVKNQGYNIFNPSDSFYNDICTPFNSFNDTDVLIKDRKKDYYNKELVFCEEGCEFDSININLNKVKCKCEIKKEIRTDTKFSTSKLLENFYKIDSFSNFKIFICYNLVFNKNGQIKNYGSYIILGITFSFILSTVINIITYSKKINNILESILDHQSKLIDFSKNVNLNKDKIDLDGEKKPNEENLEISSKANIKKNRKKKKKKKIKVNKSQNQQENNSNKEKIEHNENNNIISSDLRKFNQNNTVNIQPNPPKKISIKSQINLIKVRDNSKEVLEESNKNQDILIFKENKENINKLEKINKIKTDDNKNEEIIEMIIKNVEKEKRIKYFNNEELNSLKYKYALEIDDRTYIQYYWSLLKNKHLIIFTFIANDDYNIFLLKLSFFLISFSLYFAVNAMFFSDDTIHKQYEDKGKYNFVYQLPKILYSTIISVITNMLLKKLSLSQNDILKIKHNVDINKA